MQAMHYKCTLYFTNFIYTCSAKQLSSINKPFIHLIISSCFCFLLVIFNAVHHQDSYGIQVWINHACTFMAIKSFHPLHECTCIKKWKPQTWLLEISFKK